MEKLTAVCWEAVLPKHHQRLGFLHIQLFLISRPFFSRFCRLLSKGIEMKWSPMPDLTSLSCSTMIYLGFQDVYLLHLLIWMRKILLENSLVKKNDLTWGRGERKKEIAWSLHTMQKQGLVTLLLGHEHSCTETSFFSPVLVFIWLYIRGLWMMQDNSSQKNHGHMCWPGFPA